MILKKCIQQEIEEIQTNRKTWEKKRKEKSTKKN